MTIEINKLLRLRVDTEAAGSFCVDGSGTLGNFVDVPIVEGSFSLKPMQATLPPEYAQQHLDGWETEILGLKSWTASFTMNLAPTGTPAGNGTAALQSPLGEILKAVLGGEHLGTGNTVASGPAVTGFTATSAAGFAQGSYVGFDRDDGIFEARPIKTISGNAITLRLNYSEAPDVSDIAYAFATYYPTQDPDTSLQFLVEGWEQTDRLILFGGQLDSLAFTNELGVLPRLTFNLKGPHWIEGDEGATNLTGSALGIASYIRTAPVPMTGKFFYQNHSTVTLPTGLAVPKMTFVPSIGYVPQTAIDGVQTVKRWRRNRTAPVMTGTFNVPREDFAHWDDRDTSTLKQLFTTWGVAAGRYGLIDVPQAQITDVQPDYSTDTGQLTVSWKAQLDSQTSGTTDLSKAAFRIAFG